MVGKKGVTLIELMVAMGIFATIAAMVVGAYVTVSRMKALTSTMRESQQKIRIASEMITRLSRQAERVRVTGGGKNLELYFDINGTPKAARFIIVGNTLQYQDQCAGPITAVTCLTWPGNSDFLVMLPITLDTAASSFEKTAVNGLAELKLVLVGDYGVAITNPFYNDHFKLETSVILENLK